LPHNLYRKAYAMESLRLPVQKSAVLPGFCLIAAEALKVKIGVRVTLTLASE
jgi:hypothetical protein